MVPGERTAENAREAVREVHDRTGGKGAMLLTSDAYPAYAAAIEEVYGEWVQPERKPGPGRPPNPRRELPAGLVYATVRKRREKGRVVEVVKAVVFGAFLLDCWLRRSEVSNTINTSFVERNNATDRHQNARKRRKTYCFSKSKRMHDCATYFVSYSYNFCWEVRTLRVKEEDGAWQARTPAMAAGLADHVWSLEEWLAYPAKPRSPV